MKTLLLILALALNASGQVHVEGGSGSGSEFDDSAILAQLDEVAVDTTTLGVQLDTVAVDTTTLANTRAPRASKTESYTLTEDDHVIFAESTVNTISTMTLPLADAKAGQIVRIYKVDTGTMPVAIVPQQGETILGRSTITLNAYGAGQELISDGADTWLALHGRLNTNQTFLGPWSSPGSNAAASTANVMYFHTVKLDSPCATKSARFVVGSQSGSMSIALYDQDGNVVLSTGPFTVPASGDTQGANVLVPTVNLQPGIYYLGFGADGTLATFGRVGINQSVGEFSLAANVSPPASSIALKTTSGSNRSFAVALMCEGAYGGYP